MWTRDEVFRLSDGSVVVAAGQQGLGHSEYDPRPKVEGPAKELKWARSFQGGYHVGFKVPKWKEKHDNE